MARGWGRKFWKNKDSQEGQPLQCLGHHGCQESQGSQVNLGPPRERKNKIKSSVLGRREPVYKRNYAPPTNLTAQSINASLVTEFCMSLHGPRDGPSPTQATLHVHSHQWSSCTFQSLLCPSLDHGSKCGYNKMVPPM